MVLSRLTSPSEVIREGRDSELWQAIMLEVEKHTKSIEQQILRTDLTPEDRHIKVMQLDAIKRLVTELHKV